MHTFPIIKEKGHIIIDINGKRGLIDTGAPITFGTSNLEFCGKNYTPSEKFFGHTTDDLSRLSGIKIDFLIGNDLLSKQKMRIRWKEGFIDFGNDIEMGDNIQKYNNFMGSIVFPIKISDKDTNAILDTGAFISYISDDLVTGMEKIKTVEDFHPLAGNYKTDVYKIPVNMNGRSIDMHFGVLPDQLKLMTFFIFDITNSSAVVGTEIFEHFDCTLDWENEEISWE